jgi:D-xylulose kinase
MTVAAPRAFLGIDCGTQSTRALLLADDGRTVLGMGRADHDLVEREDGTREQDPGWWWSATAAAVRAALHSAGPVEVAGMAVSGQQHGLVALDAAERPVRLAKLWNDTTTVAQCARLTTSLGGDDALLSLTGNRMLTGYTAPKIAWLAEQEPDAYAAARRLCLPHDYLNLRLTGSFATEPGDASGTAYFDVRRRAYAEPVLAAIDDARDWEAALPPVVDSLSVIGNLDAAAAAELGLPAGIPVSAGGGDNMCAAIGVGAVVEGPLVVSLGTSGTAFARSDAPAIDPAGEAAAYCDSAGGWLPLVCTLNCTLASEWVRGLLGLERPAFESAIVDTAPGAEGLSFLPHLDGERTPNLPRSAGVFSGLRASHRAEHLVRAVVEGVTFGLAYALGALRRAGVEPSEITLVGGGAASDGWAQLCADVFGAPVRRERQPEAAALGAARQARHVVDGTPLGALEGTRQVTAADRFEPRPGQALREAGERLMALREMARAGRL